MGLRGPGAKTLKERPLLSEGPGLRPPQAWDDPKLSRADKVIVFCEELTVTSGPDAFKKLVLRPWQKRFIKQVYRTESDGSRPVRTAILSMGRKNGKTQLAAALALAHLCGPEVESRGEIYSCANDRFQSSKIFFEMCALIRNHPVLADQCNVISHRKEIQDLLSGSVYTALSKEAKTKMGLSPSFVVYDELGQTDGRELYDAMDSALGGRKEPLLLVISTQAADDFAPLSELIDYGQKVEQGEIKDPTFHLTFYTAPMELDPWSKKTWRLANPALDDFRSLADVKRLAAQAKRMPARENAFRNLILNQRVSAEARFLEPSAWRACAEEAKIPVGARVFAGLDLGSTRDLTALVLVYPNPLDGIFHVRPYFWIPGNLRERGDEERVPYEAWAKQGYIMPIGVSTDPKVIAHKIAELNGQNKIISLAFDRWRMAEVKRELDDIGCSVTLQPHGQGYKDMSAAVNVVERLVVQQKLRHGNHPVLSMCANNAIVTRDPTGARKFDKAKSVGRIDGMVAMAMALAIATVYKPVDIGALIG